VIDRAARLDIDLDRTEICLACLSFVSMELDRGDGERQAHVQARRIAPDLWAEGLEQPVRAALRRARAEGDPDAEPAIRHLVASGAASPIVEAVIMRLAQELNGRAHAAALQGDDPMAVMGFTRWSDTYPTEGDV
jgi:hypothetical protein